MSISRTLNIIVGSILLLFIIVVSFPLTVMTIQEGGGPWGFGMIGLSILIPLNFYFIFSIASFIRSPLNQRRTFVIGHSVTVSIGFVTFLIFQVVPIELLLTAMALALVGIVDKKRLTIYLRLMMACGILANSLLLKWELDFGRTIPIIELFQ